MWSHFSLPAGSNAACVKLQNELVSITQHMTPLPTIEENNPA
jgi:hypothetical protein